MSVSDTERIYSIRIKKQESEWVCRYDKFSETIDFSHPLNDYFEVYVWYSVPVLDVTKANGFVYKHGTWDKYVYKTLNDFFSNIESKTDEYRFNEYYK